MENKKKNLWPNKQLSKVDWEHLDLALKNKPNMYKNWRSKQNPGSAAPECRWDCIWELNCQTRGVQIAAEGKQQIIFFYAQTRIGPNYLLISQTNWGSG